jgi:transcriptional regulator with GAF, ATPase, and Fis domain
LESELFGHERGAFTGATNDKRGRFELADGGTLFLDEVGEISPETQVKLLRVLDTREFERVGGEKTHRVDVRIVAATNKNLWAAVRNGEYRDDLYYRLGAVAIHMPPLRERREDIPLLVDTFIHEFSAENGKKVSGITNQAMRFLMRYDWFGNVRELKNCIEGMVVMARNETLDVDDLPEHILMADTNRTTQILPAQTYKKREFPLSLPPAPIMQETTHDFVLAHPIDVATESSRFASSIDGGGTTLSSINVPYEENQFRVHVGMSLEEIEKKAIEETLQYTDNNKAKTARILGIGKRTLYRKIKKYGLSY